MTIASVHTNIINGEGVEELSRALIRVMTSLFGVQAVRGLITQEFQRDEIILDDRGQLEIRQKYPEFFKRLIATLVARMAKDFGYDFSERTLRYLYTAQLQKSRKGMHTMELLEVIPEGFLEREKIQYLSKEELEEKVLQRTQELRDLNMHLEQTVLERTKELVAANKKLEEANQELERLTKAKTEFLSLASHQLRAPLTATRWILLEFWASRDRSLSLSDRQLFEKLLSNNERMTRLINNLLSIARIEEGRLQYEFGIISLDELLEDSVNVLTPIAVAKGVVLDYTLGHNEFLVRADKEKIGLALENIIENAIKYTLAGKRVRVTVTKDIGTVVIHIQDEGIGIPQDEQLKIFDKFFRAKNAVKTETMGSGLGLFIVKKIIEDHGGRVTFESKEGTGTTFLIEIPLAN